MKACMQSLSSSGMVHQGCRSVAERGHVANWMGGATGGGGVHYAIGRSFGLAADGDGEFLLFGNVVPVGNDSFGRNIRQVVAFDVSVSSDFVQYCSQSKYGNAYQGVYNCGYEWFVMVVCRV